jgi:hypothetical protein
LAKTVLFAILLGVAVPITQVAAARTRETVTAAPLHDRVAPTFALALQTPAITVVVVPAALFVATFAVALVVAVGELVAFAIGPRAATLGLVTVTFTARTPGAEAIVHGSFSLSLLCLR